MSFGRELRRVRAERRMSQHKLAEASGVSQRHISYLESGKSTPSRGMVIHLGRSLSLSEGLQNSLLLAAGYAPAFADAPLKAPTLEKGREAMMFVLERHEPCPALALDRHWKVVAANSGFSALAGFLIAGNPALELEIDGSDYLSAIAAKEGLAKYLVAAERVACDTLERVHRDAIATGDEVLRVRAERLLSELDRPKIREAVGTRSVLPTVEFVRDEVKLNFMSITVAFSTPCAVELAHLRMEIFYPADDATRKRLEGWQVLRGSGNRLSSRSP